MDRISGLDCFKSWRKEGVNVDNNLLLLNNEVRQEFLRKPVVDYATHQLTRSDLLMSRKCIVAYTDGSSVLYKTAGCGVHFVSGESHGLSDISSAVPVSSTLDLNNQRSEL